MLVEAFQEEPARKPDRREIILLLVAATFVSINAAALGLAQAGRPLLGTLVPALIWLLLMLLAHLALRRFKPRRDPLILPLLALLSGWGVILLARLAPNFLWRQLIWLVLSVAIMLCIAILPRNLRLLRRYRYTWLLAGLLLLGATLLFGVNPSGFGPTLWLGLPVPLLGPTYFQPSELLKLLLIIFLASYFAEREPLLRSNGTRRLANTLPYLAPLLLMWGFCMTLLVWQQDLGAAALFFLVFLAMLFLASGDYIYLIVGGVLMLLAAAFAYFAFDLVALRVEAWWNPWPDAQDRAYQIVQSLYALAAGALSGQGVGQGFPEYVPVVHSDFAFVAIGEEWGLVGSFTVVVCFALLTYRGFRIASCSGRTFQMYLAAGLTLLVAVQSLLIMAGITRLLPLTGVTLPFVSYGGSSLLLSSVIAGLLLLMSADTNQGQV